MVKYVNKYSQKTIVILVIICLVALTFSACTPKDSQDESAKESDFAQFADDLFKHYVVSDAITLNYMLAKPEDYGVQKPEPSFGEYSEEVFEEDYAYCKEQYKRLQKIDRSKLDGEEKIAYDTVLFDLKANESAENSWYFYDAFSPERGVQMNLPIALSEYHFYKKEDFTYYLQLLEDFPRYFDDIITFEKIKKQKGLFMAKKSCEESISGMRDFVATKEDNLLISSFSKTVDAFDGLKEKEKADIKEKNKKAILNVVLPAYEKLITDLEQLNADNNRTGGTAALEGGADDYINSIRRAVGTKKDAEGIKKALTDRSDKFLGEIKEILEANPDVYDKLDGVSFGSKDPRKILEHLRDELKAYDFTPLEDDSFEVKMVDKSMEKYVSPAFYMISPIDSHKNTIYLNNPEEREETYLYSTLVHEGFPGHLYQSAYFKAKNKIPYREYMDFSGYTEGWATFAEHAYGYAYSDTPEAKVLPLEEGCDLMLFAIVDFMVNYEGASLDDIAKYYVDEYSVDPQESKEMASGLYDYVVAESGVYQYYALGWVEFLELKEAYKGSKADFHKIVLSAGPTSFDVLKELLAK